MTEDNQVPCLYPEAEPVQISQEDIDDLYLRVYGHESPKSPRVIARAKQEYEAAKREEEEVKRKEEKAYQKALYSPWTYILAALVIIANILFFIPMLILTLIGVSRHPFLGYFFFHHDD